MFKEWKAIFKKPKIMVVMLGVALIPALYNVIFLSSMWDPYGKLSDLPVAVVNQDQKASLYGQDLSIGSDMVQDMKKNAALDFHFVDADQAEKGLEKGDYYMVVTLPKDLSANAASILSNQPKQVTINYQTSSGHSFIASKMSDSAMTSMKQSVSQKITNSYVTSLFASMDKLKGGLGTAADGTAKLAEGSQELANGSKKLSTNLESLAQSSLTFSDGATALSTGLVAYTNGVAQINAGLPTFTSKMTEYTDGVGQLSAGASQLTAQSQTLLNGTNQLTGNSQELVAGVERLNSGLAELQSSVNSSVTANQEKVAQLTTGLDQLNTAIQNATSGTSLPTETIAASLTTIATNAQSLASSAQSDRAAAVAALEGTAAYQKLSASEQEELKAALAGGADSSSSAAAAIVQEVQAIQTNLQGLQTASSQASQLSAAANQVLPGASAMINGLYGGLGQGNEALSSASTGSATLSQGITAYTGGLSQVAQGVAAYTAGVDQLSQGAANLASHNDQVTSGIGQISSGLSQLNDKSSTLVTGMQTLSTGATQMADGSQQLAAGGLTLNSGLGDLSIGAQTLNTGLTNAKGQLSELSVTEDNAAALAGPVELKKTDKDQVGKNGVGMAPYMISVALFVAAISTNVIFGTLPSGQVPASRKAWLRARLEVNGLISILAGILVYGAVHLIGLEANYEWMTLALTVLASMAFMAVVTTLVTWDSKVGAFVSLILLLLQLASSAGTYPLPLTAEIFQVLNPILPMSYAVSGLRETISMNGQIGGQLAFLVATLLLFMVLGTMAYRPDKKEII